MQKGERQKKSTITNNCAKFVVIVSLEFLWGTCCHCEIFNQTIRVLSYYLYANCKIGIVFLATMPSNIKHLMTGPEGNSEFFSRESQCLSRETLRFEAPVFGREYFPSKL